MAKSDFSKALAVKTSSLWDGCDFSTTDLTPDALPVLAAQVPPGHKLTIIIIRSKLRPADFAPWPQLVPDL